MLYCYLMIGRGSGGNTDLDSFVRRMRVLAAQQRLDTDKAVARAAGVNDFVVHNLSKAGRKYFPTADNAVRIARALGSTVEYLVTGDNPGHDMMRPELRRLCGILEGLSQKDLENIESFVEGMKVKTAVGEVPRESRAAGQ